MRRYSRTEASSSTMSTHLLLDVDKRLPLLIEISVNRRCKTRSVHDGGARRCGRRCKNMCDERLLLRRFDYAEHIGNGPLGALAVVLDEAGLVAAVGVDVPRAAHRKARFGAALDVHGGDDAERQRQEQAIEVSHRGGR